MKQWFEKNKFFLKSWKFKLIILTIVIFLVVGLIFGFEVLGYFISIFIFLGFYLLAKQAESERIISPKEVEGILIEIEELEKEKNIIEEHLTKHDELESKLMLKRINDEIESLKNMIPEYK